MAGRRAISPRRVRRVDGRDGSRAIVGRRRRGHARAVHRQQPDRGEQSACGRCPACGGRRTASSHRADGGGWRLQSRGSLESRRRTARHRQRRLELRRSAAGPSALLESRRLLVEYARRFGDVIRKAGARPALYMVWPSRERRQDAGGVSQSYRAAAKAVSGLILPAGDAWNLVLQRRRELALYSDDGLHPTVAGTYLAALVIYQGLYDRSPIGLPPAGGLVGRRREGAAGRRDRRPRPAGARTVSMDEHPHAATHLTPDPAGAGEPGLAVADGDRAGWRSLVIDLTPLRVSRDFRLLFAGQGVTLFGSMMTFVALPMQMFQLTHSSFAVGMLSVAEFVPMILDGVCRRGAGRLRRSAPHGPRHRSAPGRRHAGAHRQLAAARGRTCGSCLCARDSLPD